MSNNGHDAGLRADSLLQTHDFAFDDVRLLNLNNRQGSATPTPQLRFELDRAWDEERTGITEWSSL